MSFFTSLTGLNAATTQLSVTSNNIANAGTTGFKRSRSDFGDIYATSPLQKASTVIGQGTALKQVTQEFSQGNIELSGNSLDLAVTGEGFFPIDAGEGQQIFTRNGSFLLNDEDEVVNSVGQNLLVAAVRDDGSADTDDLRKLKIDPKTVGLAVATGNVELSVNLPSTESPILTDATVPQLVPFDPSDSSTYAKSNAINIYDNTGKELPMTVYYRRIQIATPANPENKWQTHVIVNGQEVSPELSPITTNGKPLFVDKYGEEYTADELPAGAINDNTVFRKYVYDDIAEPEVSVPATARGDELTLNYKTGTDGVKFSATPASAQFSLSTVAISDFSEGKESEVGDGAYLWGPESPIQLEFADAAGNTLLNLSTTTPASANVSFRGIEALADDDVIHINLTPVGGTASEISITVGSADLAVGASIDDLVDAINTKLTNTDFDAALSGKTIIKTINGVSTVVNVPEINFTNDAGENFSISLGVDHSVADNDFKIYEQVSSLGGDLGENPSPATANGFRLTQDTATIDGLISAFSKSASNSDFNFSKTDDGKIEITNSQGIDFTVKDTSSDVGGSRTRSSIFAEMTVDSGVKSTITSNGIEAIDLSAAFKLQVDADPLFPNETDEIEIDLSSLTEQEDPISGDRVADLMTKQINRTFGDEKYFDLSSDQNRQFRILINQDPTSDDNARAVDVVIERKTNWLPDDLADEIQTQLRSATNTKMEVSYDRASHGFIFLPEDDSTELSIQNIPASASITGALTPNVLFGLPNLASSFPIDSRGRYQPDVIPNGEEILPLEDLQQRYGLKVEFVPSSDETESGGYFTISSGTSGDKSAISIIEPSENAQNYFGFQPSADGSDNLTVLGSLSPLAVRGVESDPAFVEGKPVGFDPEDTFPVDINTNTFTVTVNQVTETFDIPISTDYDVSQLRSVLQNRINAMADSKGNSVSGVSVIFNQETQVFEFTTGTSGNNAFLQVSGPSFFGLEGLESAVGRTQTFRKPQPAVTENDTAIYVKLAADGTYQEFSADFDSGFQNLPEGDQFDDANPPAYSPVFLGKGELTFDTSGRLKYPSAPLIYKDIEIGPGSTLDVDVDFANSTQNAGDFSINAQGQDGKPEGSLVSLDIADDGAVTASYSNGVSQAKGRIVLMSFATPNGLRQLGDSTFLASKESGDPEPGTPGSPGYGTIRAGARERANVDLTSELVDLITAQRNFQANAKAIETSSTLTSTIINIRS